MSTQTAKYILVAVATLCATPAYAAAASSFTVTGVVPTVCRASIDGDFSPLHAGLNDLGRITELCNDVDGYRLVLSHPAGVEDASMLIDGQQIAIEPDAVETVLVDSNVPADRQRHLQLVLGDSVPDLTRLTIYAEPKGIRF